MKLVIKRDKIVVEIVVDFFDRFSYTMSGDSIISQMFAATRYAA